MSRREKQKEEVPLQKKTKVIRFGLLTAGILFLFNPNASLVDVLPDCIGYLCLSCAISRAADLCGELADAQAEFRRLFWITLSKVPAWLLATLITARSVGEESILLTLTFAYAVAETVFGIRAFARFFAGLGYFGTRYDGGEFLYRIPARPKKTRTKDGVTVTARDRSVNGLVTLSCAFIIFKSVFTVLPELSLLSNYDSLGTVTPDSAVLYRYRPLLIGFSCVLVLIFGLVWLSRMLAYVRHLRRHTAFWDSLSEKYRESVLPKVGIFVMRRVQAFMVVASLAAFTSVDMYLDEINYIPDFLSALLFLAAALVIWQDARAEAKSLLFAAGLYLVTSVATCVTMLGFTSEYAYSSVHKIERARTLFMRYAGANDAEQIAFLACVWALAAICMQLARAHTGVGAIAAASDSRKPLCRVFFRKTVWMRVWAVLMSAMSIAYFYFVTDVQRIALPGGSGPGGHTWFPRFEFAWILDVTLGLIFAVYTANLISDLNAEVRYKYKFE